MQKLKHLLILSILFYSCNSKTVYIKAVHDGDSYYTSDGEKIRLAAADAPELQQVYGKEALYFVSKLILHKTVKIKSIGHDKYGRNICEVWIGNIWLEDTLIKSGLAWHYSYFDRDERLETDEQIARLNHIGLWKQSNPVNPYYFRKLLKH